LTFLSHSSIDLEKAQIAIHPVGEPAKLGAVRPAAILSIGDNHKDWTISHPGRNQIAATVWSYGTTTVGQISDRTAFVLRGETDAENIVDTNNSWEAAEEKGIQLRVDPPVCS
jgi:hypothetical protein